MQRNVFLQRIAFTITLCILCTVAAAALSGKIKHVVLLMEENRSFDHMFGLRPGVNGINQSFFNWVNLSNPALGKIPAGSAATTINSCDPDHGLPGTTFKIFGTLHPELHEAPKMDGFVEWERRLGNTNLEYCDVMTALNRSQLPVINALADEFLLFDAFFASVPGPTWPNRLFFLCGTSGGQTETTDPWWQQQAGQLVPLPTIMDQFTESGLEWRAYVNDTPWELFVSTMANHPEKIFTTDQFFEDARNGNLPALSVLNPRAGMNFSHGLMANDMHPDHDTSLGEAYYKDIYEALRSSPCWNDTLFILTFDEHGGFFDHVPTVLDIPAPDNYSSYPDKFDFKRLGIRIPTLLISPWISKGVVESRPPEKQRPFPNSQYELTSVMATLRNLFNITLGPLTKRDAWAATFEHLLENESNPRTDCPMHLPDPAPSSTPPEVEAMKPLNSLQKHIATVHAHLAGLEFPHHITTQHEISEWLQNAFQIHKQNVLTTKKQSFIDLVAPPLLNLRCEPFYGMSPPYANCNWLANGNLTTHVFSLSSKVNGIEYCLTADNLTSGGEVTALACNTSAPPSAQEEWIIGDDNTLRPKSDVTLCATTMCVGAQNPRMPVFLDTCDVSKTVYQHWTMTPVDFEANWNTYMQILIGVWALVVDTPNHG